MPLFLRGVGVFGSACENDQKVPEPQNLNWKKCLSERVKSEVLDLDKKSYQSLKVCSGCQKSPKKIKRGP